MTDVRMTTIIAWRDRPELGETLRHNTPFLDAMRSDVIVVNSGGDSRALRQLRRATSLPTTQIDLPHEQFNKSCALNVGIHEARPGVILILDADILLTTSLAPYAARCAGQECFAIGCGMSLVPPRPPAFDVPPGPVLKNVVSASTLEFHWVDGTVSTVFVDRLDYGSGRRVSQGIILARKAHLVEVGGYRSDFVGWGWEDLDIHVRLLRRGLACVYFDDEIKHLEHGDEMRDLRGPKKEGNRANRWRAWQAYAAGEFAGTYEADIRLWRSTMSRTPSLEEEEADTASRP
jgi:hypothetical protein